MSKLFSHLSLAILTVGLAASASAATFDGSTGTTQTATINAAGGADYTSLKAASNDFNAVATINRPWVLLIDSDLAETERVAFGTNVADGASLTIKPAPTKTPTITFTNPAAVASTVPGPNSYFGALVIGANNSGILDGVSPGSNPTASSIFETNNAYIFDGSNTAGGTTRDMTFFIDTTGDATGYIMRVVGSTNGLIVKNMKLINRKGTGNNNGIGFGAGNIAGFGSQGGDYKSDNAIIENCLIEAKRTTSGTSGIAVNYSVAAFGALTVPKQFENHIVRNNYIDARHRGISALYSVNCSYTGNEFHIAMSSSGANSGAIQHLLQNGTFPTPYTVTIANNKVLDLQSSNTTVGAFGIAAISLAGGTNANYKVYNNVVTGFLLSAPSPVDINCQAINCGSTLSNFDVEHNSINIAPQAGVSGATIGRSSGIYFNNSTSATASSFRNNIVRYAVGKGAPLVLVSTGATAVPVDPGNVTGNDLFQAVVSDPLSPLAYIGAAATPAASATPYVDQAALVTAGYNTGGGQSVDPAATTPPWAADLSFAAAPVGLGSVTSSNVLFDINNQPRAAAGAYPGAYRIISNSNVNEWTLY